MEEISKLKRMEYYWLRGVVTHDDEVENSLYNKAKELMGSPSRLDKIKEQQETKFSRFAFLHNLIAAIYSLFNVSNYGFNKVILDAVVQLNGIETNVPAESTAQEVKMHSSAGSEHAQDHKITPSQDERATIDSAKALFGFSSWPPEEAGLVKKRYHQLLKKCHPDKIIQLTGEEKELKEKEHRYLVACFEILSNAIDVPSQNRETKAALQNFQNSADRGTKVIESRTHRRNNRDGGRFFGSDDEVIAATNRLMEIPDSDNDNPKRISGS